MSQNHEKKILLNNSNKLINIRIRKNKKKVKKIDDKIDDKIDEHPIVSVFIKPIEDFLYELEKTRKIVYNINGMIGGIMGIIEKDMEKITGNNIVEDNDEYKHIKISIEEHKIFHKLRKEMQVIKDAPDRILRSFFISMFSLYEDFLANQVRMIYNKYPQKLQNDKQLIYEEFSKMTTLQEIQDYFIENSIRQIISKDTLSQVIELEKLLDIKNKLLYNNLPIKELVEISSRRNLVVHNESKVNNNYINNCHKVEITVSDDMIGEVLDIDKDYFINVFNILYESTMIISYLVGRKVFGGDNDSLEKIDSYFNSSCVELISPDKKESIHIPLKLLRFVASNNEIKHKEIDRLLFTINNALCHKINGDENEMRQILDKIDWSGCHSWLQFGYYVLIEDYNECMKLFESVSIPRKIAEEKNIESIHFDEDAYRDFPIFYKIKEEKIFLDKYKEFFGEELQNNDYN